MRPFLRVADPQIIKDINIKDFHLFVDRNDLVTDRQHSRSTHSSKISNPSKFWRNQSRSRIKEMIKINLGVTLHLKLKFYSDKDIDTISIKSFEIQQVKLIEIPFEYK